MAEKRTPGTSPEETSVATPEQTDVPVSPTKSEDATSVLVVEDYGAVREIGSRGAANAGEHSRETTAPAPEPAELSEASLERTAHPLPTISLPEGDDTTSEDGDISKSKPRLHDLRLTTNPLPPPSPHLPQGIPVPIGINPPDLSSNGLRGPTRTSSRNAHTTAAAANQQSATSASLGQSNSAGHVPTSSMVFVR